MSPDQFWKLIDAARAEADGDGDALADHVEQALVALGVDATTAFAATYDRLMDDAYRHDLWGAAYLLNGGCSDDGFEYFRCWLIGQGRAVYDAALADPDALARFAGDDDLENESLLYAGMNAYQTLTGKDLPPSPGGPPALKGTDWEEAQLEELFPKIAKKLAAD